MVVLLIQAWVRPYQNLITEKPIKGLKLDSKKSGIRSSSGRFPIYWGQDKPEKFYFNSLRQIYSDKIALFVIRCNELTKGVFIDRLSKIYDQIYIDEVQDLAGYDLDIIHEILKKIPTVLVGDPRQVTYKTHHTSKHKSYKNGLIDKFLEEKCGSLCKIDSTTLKDSYRCHQDICTYSSTLFPDLPQVKSLSDKTTDHDGIFFITKKDVPEYLERYAPVQLRYNRSTKITINDKCHVYNFGESKGLTFDRVLIHPTASIKSYIQGKSLPISTLCRFYVALTRARHSVSIVWDKPPTIDGISTYSIRDE